MTGGNTPDIVKKFFPKYFSKSSTTQEKIRISKAKKKFMKLVQKEHFEPKTKLIIENLQNKLYQ